MDGLTEGVLESVETYVHCPTQCGGTKLNFVKEMKIIGRGRICTTINSGKSMVLGCSKYNRRFGG